MAINLFSGGNFINSLAAAGKNAVINGGMDVWQRGTSIAGAATASYTADRFSLYQNTAATVSRQATSDTTNLPNIQYCLRAQRNNASTSTSGVSIAQSIESINSIPFAGKTITYSFYARKGANFSGASSNISVYVVSGTGTDQNIHTSYTGASYIVSSTATLTTTWQRFTFTATVASTATELAAYQEYTPVGTAGAADYFEITGVQLELGTTATTFSRAGGSIGGELALCQRYCVKYTTDASDKTLGTGTYYNSTVFISTINFPTMRTAPTATIVNGTNYWIIYTNGTSDYCDTATFASATLNSGNLEFSGNVSGTQGHGGQVRAFSTSASLILSSEL